jgi:hypothetical protein
MIYVSISVADLVPYPDPDPSDPYVFGPPGSGSISQMYGSGSGSFCHQEKPRFLLFCDFFMTLSLKNDVNLPLKSKFFDGFLKVNDEKFH